MIIIENKNRKNTQFIGGELTYKWFYKGISSEFEGSCLISADPVRLDTDLAAAILKRIAEECEKYETRAEVKITHQM